MTFLRKPNIAVGCCRRVVEEDIRAGSAGKVEQRCSERAEAVRNEDRGAATAKATVLIIIVCVRLISLKSGCSGLDSGREKV